ncbi:MAG TPA: alpha/beta hydrolase [Rhizomicrobium sp.]|nr:alpha/beta hydrolase [Rhizomicrobium sp.]
MFDPTSHNYFSQRLRLHYVDWGNEGAPPLVMIHGGRDHCRNWDWAAERLRDRFHILAPDLRGHGDSQWAEGANYGEINYVYDIAQLVHQRANGPVILIAHSLGGSIALLYAGIFPETVKKVVAIEGLGPSPEMLKRLLQTPIDQRARDWITMRREMAGRVPRKYAKLEDAVQRMRDENPRLTEDQAWHLTTHGALQNEDGTYSWKFDNYVRMGGGPGGLSHAEQHNVWSRIGAPVLLVRGVESWASDPVIDGRIAHFRDARRVNIEGAGHWVHHDRLDAFMGHVERFLGE